LQPVGAQAATNMCGSSKCGSAAPDRGTVPPSLVLISQQDGIAVGPGAGRDSRRGQLEQCEQAVDLGLVRDEAGKDPSEADRLVRKVGADQILPDVTVEPSLKIT
jgi:hypothetical protein